MAKTPQPHVRPRQEVIDLASECFAEDIYINAVLDRADVNRSTWARWRRKGTRPERPTLAKLQTALAELVAERNERAGAGPD